MFDKLSLSNEKRDGKYTDNMESVLHQYTTEEELQEMPVFKIDTWNIRFP